MHTYTFEGLGRYDLPQIIFVANGPGLCSLADFGSLAVAIIIQQRRRNQQWERNGSKFACTVHIIRAVTVIFTFVDIQQRENYRYVRDWTWLCQLWVTCDSTVCNQWLLRYNATYLTVVVPEKWLCHSGHVAGVRISCYLRCMHLGVESELEQYCFLLCRGLCMEEPTVYRIWNVS